MKRFTPYVVILTLLLSLVMSGISCTKTVYVTPTPLFTPIKNFGPSTYNIQARYQEIVPISLLEGQKATLHFDASGTRVQCDVLDPDGNLILHQSPGVALWSGGGSFVAIESGDYSVNLKPFDETTPSVVTFSYTVSDWIDIKR
jgi:hypothetical protein